MRNTNAVILVLLIADAFAYGDSFLPTYWSQSLEQDLSIELTEYSQDYYSTGWRCDVQNGIETSCYSTGTDRMNFGPGIVACTAENEGTCSTRATSEQYIQSYTPTKWNCLTWSQTSCLKWQANDRTNQFYSCGEWRCNAFNSTSSECGEWGASACTIYCYAFDRWQCTRFNQSTCIEWLANGCRNDLGARTKYITRGKPSPRFLQQTSALQQTTSTAGQGQTTRFNQTVYGRGRGECALQLPKETLVETLTLENSSGLVQFNSNGTQIRFHCRLENQSTYLVSFNATAPNASVAWEQDTRTPSTLTRQYAKAVVNMEPTQAPFQNVEWSLSCINEFNCHTTNGFFSNTSSPNQIVINATSATSVESNATSWMQTRRVSPNQTVVFQKTIGARSKTGISLSISIQDELLAGLNCSENGFQLTPFEQHESTIACEFQNAIEVTSETNWTQTPGGFEKTFEGINRAPTAINGIIELTNRPDYSGELTIQPAIFTAERNSAWTAKATATIATPTPQPPSTPSTGGGGASGGSAGGGEQTIPEEPTVTPTPKPIEKEIEREKCVESINAPRTALVGLSIVIVKCASQAIVENPLGVEEIKVVEENKITVNFSQPGAWRVKTEKTFARIEVTEPDSQLRLRKKQVGIEMHTGEVTAGRTDYTVALALTNLALAGLYLYRRNKLETPKLVRSTLAGKTVLEVTPGKTPLRRAVLIELIDGKPPSKITPMPQEVEETMLGTKVKWVFDSIEKKTVFSYENEREMKATARLTGTREGKAITLEDG